MLQPVYVGYGGGGGCGKSPWGAQYCMLEATAGGGGKPCCTCDANCGGICGGAKRGCDVIGGGAPGGANHGCDMPHGGKDGGGIAGGGT